jgi:phage terminase large subunit
MAVEFYYKPREYQKPLIEYMFSGGMRRKRAVVVWHRRAGKDITMWNILITAAIYDRVGTYFYFFPTYGQGKKIIWDGKDFDGRKFLDYVPADLIAKGRDGKPLINETEMQIELVNGSIIQIIGTDRIDSIVGTNPIGCLFSEYSIQKPMAWKLIQPILMENGGWAAFVYTPRGHNHGYTLYQAAQTEPGWFHQVLTADDTKREDGTPVMPLSEIDSLRRQGTDEDLIQQEYYCAFSGATQGAYYGNLMKLAQAEGRIKRVPWEPRFPVTSWWDLGRNDANVIWFTQDLDREVHVIDCYANTQQGLGHYVKFVRDKDYTYTRHVMPHDINVTEYSSNVKRIDVARSLGLKNITVAPKLHITEGIEAVRTLLPRCYFDQGKCEKGILALQEYHKEWDDEKYSFSDTPVHDWASNYADAFRTGAIVDRSSASKPTNQQFADSSFSVFSNVQDSAESQYSVFGV